MEGLGFLYGAAAESRVDNAQHTLGDVGCGLKERIYFHLRFFFFHKTCSFCCPIMSGVYKLCFGGGMAHFGACGVPHGRILGWSLVALEVVLVPAQQDLCSLSLEMMIKSCLVWLDQVSYRALCPVSQLWFFHGVLVFLIHLRTKGE